MIGESIPDGGYVIYRGKLYSRLHAKALAREASLNARTAPPVKRPPIKKPQPRWSELDQLEAQSLEQRRSQYRQEMKKQERCWPMAAGLLVTWRLSRISAKKKLAENQLFFAGEWHQRQQLGQWYDIVLRKGEQRMSGFLLPIKDIYRFRSKDGVLVLSNSLLQDKQERPYPWESYWHKRQTIAADDAGGHDWLACRCRMLELPRLAEMQYEKVLTLAPNYPPARTALGYFRYGDRWTRQESSKRAQKWVAFANMLIPPEQARRWRLISYGDTTQFREDAALAAWQNSGGDKHPLTSTVPPEKLFATPAKKIKGQQWQLHYSFSGKLDKTIWDYGDAVTTDNQGLMVNASGELPSLRLS